MPVLAILALLAGLMLAAPPTASSTAPGAGPTMAAPADFVNPIGGS